MRGLTAFQLSIATRLVVAALAGAVVGLEREIRDQAAGLRTHMLVSVGACLFAIVSAYGFEPVVLGQGSDFVRYDVTRVASNIVTGVGFLGAGAIIRHGLSVRGLTTAASLWVVAAIGTAVALGMYWATTVSAVITIGSLWGLRSARTRIRRAAGITRISITLRASSASAADAAFDLLLDRGYRIRSLRIDDADDGVEGYAELIPPAGGHDGERMAAELARLDGIEGIDWGSV